MLATGAAYLRLVGPIYGFFGLGLSLYFASQGAGRLALAAARRLRCASSSRSAAAGSRCKPTGSLTLVFAMLASALAIYGAIVGIAIWSGVWFRTTAREMGLGQRAASS